MALAPIAWRSWPLVLLAAGVVGCGGGEPAAAERCDNGLDDDGDALVDCADPACAALATCQGLAEDCTNGGDDDGDGLIDCRDPDCGLACPPENDCNDGVDNNRDGAVDCADGSCDRAAQCGGAGSCAAPLPARLGPNAGDTAPAPDGAAGSCGGAGAAEQVFSFTPPGGGLLRARVRADVDLAIYARTACGDGATELGCADLQPAGAAQAEELVLSVAAGVALSLVVDGASGPGGPFTLELSQE